jgi:hypothetical protein
LALNRQAWFSRSWLTKLGVTVRIVDKTAEPGTTSRALAAHEHVASQDIA